MSRKDYDIRSRGYSMFNQRLRVTVVVVSCCFWQVVKHVGNLTASRQAAYRTHAMPDEYIG